MCPLVHLFALFDSCHSGSILDLPNIYDMTASVDVKPPQVCPSPFVFTQFRRNLTCYGLQSFILLISGCKDNPTSADARPVGGAAGGAMTMSFSAAMSSGAKHTFRTLLKGMREYLKINQYAQLPQLSTQFPIDMDMPIPVVQKW